MTESEVSTVTRSDADFFPPGLASLCGVATAVLDQHLDVAGTCAACGRSWPCERVLLAEHNLAVL